MIINKAQKMMISLLFIMAFFSSLLLVEINDQSATARIDGTTDISAVATSLYLKLTGETQGDIDGGVTRAQYENWIEILSYSHSIKTPYDPTTGLPTGKRQHSPFRVTKSLDVATPILFGVLSNNEILINFEFHILAPSTTGQEVHLFTIELQNARIVSYQTSGSTAFDGNLLTETISFVYTKITWTWMESGITAEDDWYVSPV